MPRKPARLKKEQRRIPENIFKFLKDGVRVRGDVETFMLLNNENEVKGLWDLLKDEILSAWISEHPGTRPLLWWKFDSAEPRLRIGGKGQLISELYPAVFQDYEKGILSGWHSIDADNPPTFESEGSYLSRHDLLSPQEKKFLVSHPALMEAEKVIFDEDEDENNNNL
jgi:hypothetical protein